MTRRPLPPLEVGQSYLAHHTGMSFVRDLANDVPSTLRFKLASGATIDVEPTDAELRALAALLGRFYP